MQDKFEAAETNLKDSNVKLKGALDTISELESQVSACTADMLKLQGACNRLENEVADLRHQRNSISSEKDDLYNQFNRSSAEVERLQMEVTTLTTQLQTAINAKCEALAEVNEILSMKMTLEFKEKRLDQERALLNNQVETLSESLNDRTEELLNLKKDNSLRSVQLENKLIERTQELAVAEESNKNLTEINDNLTSRVEELAEQLRTERDNDQKTHELYQQEIEAQTKLADLYKNMSEQTKEHSEELAKAVNELQTILREASDKYGDLETKHKEMQLSNEEIIIKKNECIAMLKQELEKSNEVFKTMKDDTIQKEVESISPSASTASRLIKPGMTLTQIYTQYATACDELTHEREESSRLRSYIQHIINELEEKGPLLKKQREDYENALDTIKELTQQNDSLILDCQQLKDEAIQCKRNEGVVGRENSRLKKEMSDLSRQVRYTFII